MFGLGGGDKKAQMTRVGAREKMKMARNIQGGGSEALRNKNEKATPPAVAVLVIYIMSTALAYILTTAYIDNGGLHMSLGMPDLDRLLFKPNNAVFMGSPDIDYCILIMIRGLAIFIMAGLWPLCTLLYVRATDSAHINLYRAFWGTPIGLVLFILGVKEYFWPAFSEVLKLAT